MRSGWEGGRSDAKQTEGVNAMTSGVASVVASSLGAGSSFNSLLEGDGFEIPVPRQMGNGFRARDWSDRSSVHCTEIEAAAA
jgi:hypothetical protein